MTANPVSPLTPVAPVSAMPGSIPRLTPLDPIRVIVRYLRLFLAVLIIGLIAGVGLALVLEKIAPEYTSEAYLEVSGGPVDPYDPNTATSGIGKHRLEVLAAFIRNQIVLLQSDDVIYDETLKREEVQQTAWHRRFNSDEQRREWLQENMEVNRVVGSTAIRVALTDGDSAGLQAIIDIVITEFLNQYGEFMRTQTDGVRRTFEEESKRADKDLEQAQRHLDQFLELNDLPTLEMHINEGTIAYGDLSRQMAHAAIQLQTARNIYDALAMHQEKAGQKITPEELAVATSQPAIYTRDERLRGLRENRHVFVERYGVSHRTVQAIDRQIEAVANERDTELVRYVGERRKIVMDQARKTVEAMEAQIATLSPSLRDARNRVREITNKLKRYTRLKGVAESAKKKGEAADDWLYRGHIMRGRPDSPGVRELAKASSPKMTFPHFAGTVVGVTVLFEAIAIALVFVKELLDQRIKSPSDVQLIPHANVLGLLPEADEDPLGPAQIENVVHRDPTGLLSEAFRQTRTGILTQMKRGDMKSVMIVGAQPECGVSSVVNNLAVSLSLDGRKVLVIDANLRRPMQHVLFTTRSAPGLVEVLGGSATFEQAVVHLAEPSLDVLASGNGQDVAPELLEGSAFQKLMETANGRYDIVIIDAPPALLSSASVMMARHVNGVVAVVRASRDKRGMVGRMLRELESADANVLGTILNGVQASAGGYFRKNYDEFYKYRHGAADGYAGGEGPGEPMDPNPNDIRVISATQPSDGGEGPGKTDA